VGCSSPTRGHWARRWINHLSPWHMASATPDLRLPSQPWGFALWPVPNYTAWWQRHLCVNNLPKVVTRQCPGAESNLRPWVTSGLQVLHITVRLPSHNASMKSCQYRCRNMMCCCLNAVDWAADTSSYSLIARAPPPTQRARRTVQGSASHSYSATYWTEACEGEASLLLLLSSR